MWRNTSQLHCNHFLLTFLTKCITKWFHCTELLWAQIQAIASNSVLRAILILVQLSLILKLYYYLAMDFNQDLLNICWFIPLLNQLYLITLAHGKIEKLSNPVTGWHLSDYFHHEFKWQLCHNSISCFQQLWEASGVYSVCGWAASVVHWF